MPAIYCKTILCGVTWRELLGMEGRGGLPVGGVISAVYLMPVPTFQNKQTQDMTDFKK